MSDGIDIPIGGDFAALQAAFQGVQQAMDRLGQRITVAMNQAAQSSMTAKSRFEKFSTTAYQLGNAVSGAGTAIDLASRASKALTGLSLGAKLQQWVAGAGGVRAAFSQIPAAMNRIAQNPTLRKVVIAAGAATVAVVGIRTAFSAVSGAASAAGRVFSGVFSRLKSEAGAARQQVSSIGSALSSGLGGMTGGMMPIAGLLGAAGAGALLGGQLFGGMNLAGEIERITVAMQALTGSSQAATRIVEGMRTTWQTTGATIGDQAATIQKFLALGFGEADAVKLQRNILDIAGAVGMSTTEASLLGSALAQVKAKGVVSMEELRQQIAEKGVPVFEALANKIGVTQGELVNLVSQGKVPAQELIDLFLNMEGSFGKFIGGSTRMGGTFIGLINRIKGSWEIVRAAFAQPIIDSLKPMLMGAVQFLGGLKDMAAAVGEKIGTAILFVTAAFKQGLVPGMSFLSQGIDLAIKSGVNVLWKGIQGVVAFMRVTIPAIFQAAMAKLKDPNFWEGVKLIFQGLSLSISSGIAAAMGNAEDAKGYQKSADLSFDVAKRIMNQPSAGGDMSEDIAKAMREGGEAFVAAIENGDMEAYKIARENWQKTISDLAPQVDKIRESMKKLTAPAADQNQTGTPALPDTASAANLSDTLSRAVIPAVRSLTRIGGGGGGMPGVAGMVGQQRVTNRLLADIKRVVGVRQQKQITAVYS